MSNPAEEADVKTVTVVIEGDVGTVTMRRPPHNFLTVSSMRELAAALEGLAGHCRAAVLAAEGRSFCAGASFRADDSPDPSAGSSFAETARSFYVEAMRVFESPVPVVAAVQGAAVGGGLGLMLACDIRVMSEAAWVQANFVRLGIHPGFALSATLPAFVGRGRAADLFLTGRRVDAGECLELGLVERVVAPERELGTAREIAAEIAAAAPLAVESTRSTLRRGLADLARRQLEHELAEQARLAGTYDAIEGVAAMLQRREPSFQGR
jgi:enoyl-CoA hydratase/carnithine racemase